MDNDFELIKRYLAGEEACFEELVKKYWKEASEIAYHHLGNFEEAKDISQMAFIRVFRSLKNFRFESSFSTWLYRIVVNLCINHQQRSKKTVPLEEVEYKLEGVERGVRQENNLKLGLLREAIYNLKEPYRQCLILKDIQCLSYKEIVNILGCPIGTVMSRLNFGRKIVKQNLREGEELK